MQCTVHGLQNQSDLKHFRLFAAVLALLVSALAISAKIAETVHASASATAELPAAANAEAPDGEEHPQPAIRDTDSATRRTSHPILVVGPHPLIIDGRPFRPPLRYRLHA